MVSFRVSIDSLAFVLCALLLLVFPIKWVLGFLTAAVWHEFCHYMVLYLSGISVHGIRIGLTGIKMDIPQLPLQIEFFCALAGPLGGFLLFLCYRWFPEAALCALIQSLFNLLPVYPQDGGRVLRCIMQWVLPRNAETVCDTIEMLTVVVIFLFGMAFHWELLSICTIVLLISKIVRRKIPCKLY